MRAVVVQEASGPEVVRLAEVLSVDLRPASVSTPTATSQRGPTGETFESSRPLSKDSTRKRKDRAFGISWFRFWRTASSGCAA